MTCPILNSWKEIASYLQRAVRTVQRWERDKALPVRRIGNSVKSPVFAYPAEMDTWLRAYPIGLRHREDIVAPQLMSREAQAQEAIQPEIRYLSKSTSVKAVQTTSRV